MGDNTLPVAGRPGRRTETGTDPFADPARFKGILARRVVAYLVDVVLIAALAVLLGAALWLLGVLTFGLLAPLPAILLALLPLAYHTASIGGYGATPGMLLLDVEVRQIDGRRPDYAQALVATVLFYLGIVVTGWLILVVALFNPRRRTMHDYFAGLVVVRRQ